jgi:uncharacterized cupredoxin-like copper-binding protein
MSMIARRYLVATVVAGVALAGCSSSSKSASTTTPTTSATSAAPTSAPAAATLPHVTVTARDYAFTIPPIIPAGYVSVTLVNKGKQDHQLQFVELGASTYDAFKTAAATTNIGAVSKNAVFVGGPNDAAPGKSTTATIKLDPGLYAITCFIPGADGKPHAALGMIGQVQAQVQAQSVEVAPVAASTILLGDFSFTLPAGFNGKGVVAVSNQGTQVHELNLFKLNPGKTVADAKAYVLTPPGTPPPAGPPPFTEVTGTVGLTPHQSAWLTMDLAPGNYMLICFFPDPTKKNIPHALEGMVKGFTIS